jgi:hypothetical protein
MEFEPVIPVGFAPRIQIGLHPFEPVAPNRTNRLISNRLISNMLLSMLLGMMMVYLKVNRARIGKPGFARSGLPFQGPAPSVSDRLKGGSK